MAAQAFAVRRIQGSYGVKELLIPNVLQELPLACKMVYWLACMLCDFDGFVELRALEIAKENSIPETTIRRAIKRLESVKLLKRIRNKTGRGNGCIFRVVRIFQKSDSKNVSSNMAKTPKVATKSNYKENKKQTIQTQGVPRSSLRGKSSDAELPGDAVLIKGSSFYRRIMKEFRLLLWKRAGLTKREQELACGLIGNRIASKTVDYARKLYLKLAGSLAELIAVLKEMREKLKGMLGSAKRFCAWFWRWIKELLGEVKRKSREKELKQEIEIIKSWLKLRESEFKSGAICGICGVVHSWWEFDEGRGPRKFFNGDFMINCFGWARRKLHELLLELKKEERERAEELYRGRGDSDAKVEAKEVATTLTWISNQLISAGDKPQEQSLCSIHKTPLHRNGKCYRCIAREQLIASGAI